MKSDPPSADKSSKDFRALKKSDAKKFQPTYKPDDPRIQQDLRRGSSVEVDLSGLSSASKSQWWSDREVELLSGGIRTPARDLIREANQQMQLPDDRYPQEDESDVNPE
jgi:hypothetical protein